MFRAKPRSAAACGIGKDGRTVPAPRTRASICRSPRLLLALCVAATCLWLSPAALADSATITVDNTSGQSDPATQLPRVFTLTGVSAAPESVFVKYRSPGGAPCAPSAQSDSGQTLDREY